MNRDFEKGARDQDAVRCPACGEKSAYGLGDGRLQCKRCRTKYTPRPRQGRLDDRSLQQIIALFWRMYTQEEAARETGLNRKTLQRYFRRIREAIAGEGRIRMDRNLGRTRLTGFFVGPPQKPSGGAGREGILPVFSLGRVGDEVVLFLPDGLEDWSGLDLDRVRFVVLPQDGRTTGAGQDTNLAEEFWLFVRPLLKRYRGGAKKSLPCYLREMEFRFNHRNDSRVLEGLHRLLLSGPA